MLIFRGANNSNCWWFQFCCLNHRLKWRLWLRLTGQKSILINTVWWNGTYGLQLVEITKRNGARATSGTPPTISSDNSRLYCSSSSVSILMTQFLQFNAWWCWCRYSAALKRIFSTNIKVNWTITCLQSWAPHTRSAAAAWGNYNRKEAHQHRLTLLIYSTRWKIAVLQV